MDSAFQRCAPPRTHHEGGSGAHNAVGTYLSGRHVLSAASDWSRYPLGTRFRLVDTSEEYVIDDYGNALVGTDTIDLYKTTRSDVRNWGVRYVDIDILQWGSEEESLKVLAPRCKHNCVRKMVAALERRRAKPSRKILPGALRLQTSDRRRADARDSAALTWRVAFDLALITLHFPRQ